MGAADFYYVRKFPGFGIERVAEIFHGGEQAARGFRGGGDVHGGGKRVVGGLRHVDVVVRMNGLLAAQFAAGDFNGAIGDHFVDVHVGLCAAAGLPDAKREVLAELSGYDFIGGPDDKAALFVRKFAQVLVHEGGGFLEDAEGADQLGRHQVFADGEVGERAGGLCAVVAVNGDLDLAHGVRLGARWNGGGWLGGFRHLGLLEWLLPRFYQQVARGQRVESFEFRNGNCWYTPGSFPKSGKQRTYRIQKMKECATTWKQRGEFGKFRWTFV